MRIGTLRSLLLVAPHPDDETIAAYGLMMRLRRRGAGITVLIVSDGRASHPTSPRWPRPRLVRERQRETRRAMARIGIPASRILFLGLPDGALPTRAADVRRGVATALHRATRPVTMLAPAATDDHPDHRVTAAAAAAAGGRGVRRLAYIVWPAGARLPGARSLPLSAQERLAKRHAIRSYRTQAGRITDDADGFAMTRAQIAVFSRSAETFVEVPR